MPEVCSAQLSEPVNPCGWTVCVRSAESVQFANNKMCQQRKRRTRQAPTINTSDPYTTLFRARETLETSGDTRTGGVEQVNSCKHNNTMRNTRVTHNQAKAVWRNRQEEVRSAQLQCHA